MIEMGTKPIKYMILMIPGLSDVPSENLDGKTPLEAAATPYMDAISSRGRIGRVKTLAGDSVVGSDKAILSILGYDPEAFPIRRGPLEATGIGVELAEDDLALRLNFVSTFNGMLVDHNAGQISDSEAASLIKMLNARFADNRIHIHSGVGYRNVLVIKGGKSLDFKTVPPHEALRQPVVDYYPYGGDARIIADLMDAAHQELAAHDINLVRVDLGENPADRIWPWGEGVDFELPAFKTLFPLEGCVVSAAPLLKGIAKKIGFHHIAVPGATGYVDTNYKAKASAALRGLDDFDLAVLHVGAVNEVCHQGDVSAKVETIETIDRDLVGPVLEGMDSLDQWRLMITSDHITPAEDTEPLQWPVPVAFCGHDVVAVREYAFSERSAQKADLFIEAGHDLMEFFLGINRA